VGGGGTGGGGGGTGGGCLQALYMHMLISMVPRDRARRAHTLARTLALSRARSGRIDLLIHTPAYFLTYKIILFEEFTSSKP
jgi:hypothetical protein